MLRPRLVLLALAALLVLAVPSAVAGTGGLGLTATVEQDGTTVDLAWDTAVPGQTLMRDDGEAVSVNDDSTSATDSIVADGSTYTWTLTQDDGNGGSAQDTAQVVSDDQTPPGPVTGLAADSSTVGEIDLSWTNPDDSDLHSVQIWRHGGGTCPSQPGSGHHVATVSSVTPGAQSSAADSSVVAGQSYCYAAWAVDNAGNPSQSADTVQATAGTDTTPPGAVSGLQANTSINGEIGLSWTNPGDSDLSYVEIWRRVGKTCPAAPGQGVSLPAVDSLTPGATGNTTDTSVIPGQHYCYAAWAFDDSDNRSQNSDTVQATASVSADTTPPGPVRRLTVTVRAGAVRLAWANPSAADLNTIMVRRGSDGCPKAATDGDRVGGLTVRRSQADGGARAGRRLCYAVFAVDASGNASRAATTQTIIPPNVSRLSAAAGCTTARLSWRNPRSTQLVRVRIIRNIRHAPRNPRDGRMRRHRSGSLLERRLHKHARYSYRLYTIYRSGNAHQPLVYSTGKVVRLRTGSVCTPMNHGVAGRRPRVRWLPVRRAHRYAVRITRGERTLLIRYPFHSAYRLRASWRQGGHTHRLQGGHVYQLYVYAYTTRHPDGVLIGQSSFRVRR